MKPKILTVLFSIISLTIAAQNSNNLPTPNEEILTQWMKELKVPGIALATFQNGDVKYSLKGANHLNEPITSETIFDVASLTKSITTLVTLKLVENGEWGLDESLGNYWTDPDVKEDTRHQKLTTRHVLSHRTGFKNWRYLNEDNKLSFDFEPGEKFQYSGEGFEYLRRALENKFKKPLEELADSLLFQPFKMDHSHLVWNDNVTEQSFAGTHNSEGKPYSYEKSFEANAADNLLITISDFANLGMNLLNQEVLDTETYNAMVKPHSEVREGINFGLGWIVFKDLPNGEYSLFNAGSDTGVNALIVLLPKSSRGLIVFTNGDNGRQLAMKSIAFTLGEAGKEILNRF